jgi:hypothetical protein
MYIPDQARFEHNSNTAVLFSFVCSTTLAAGGLITVRYPEGFFTSGPTLPLFENPSNIEGLMYATVQKASRVSFVVSIDRDVVARSVFMVTLYGLSLGAATTGSPNGISIQTTADPVSSDGSSSGSIFESKLMAASIEIDFMNRVEHKTSVQLVLRFTTFAPIPDGTGRITLTYPTGFFADGPSRNMALCNIAGLVIIGAQPATASSSSFVISIAGSNIQSNTQVTFTLTGMKMGMATFGNNTGCWVQSSADSKPSDLFDSGFILSQPIIGQVIKPRMRASVSSLGWPIYPVKFFFAGNNVSSIRVSFTARSKIHSNGAISVQFPAGYFISGPVASKGSMDTFTIVQQPVSASSPSAFSLRTTKTVARSSIVIVTLFGMVLGEYLSSDALVTISTSSDIIPTPVSNFPGIVSANRVILPWISVRPVSSNYDHQRVREDESVELIVSFFLQTPMVVNQKIYIQFPSGFFNLDTTAFPYAFVEHRRYREEVLSQYNQRIPVVMSSNAFVIVLPFAIPDTAADSSDIAATVFIHDIFMGSNASNMQGASFEVYTDSDWNPSSVPISSACHIIKRFQTDLCEINYRETENFEGNVINSTVRFSTSVASGFSPHIFSTSPLTISSSGLNEIVLTTNIAIPHGFVAITLGGCHVGPPHANEENGIRVSTSLDIISEGFPTGMISSQVTNVSFTIAASDRFPRATNKTVTFSFTIATALSAGDTITLHYPVGFFDVGVTPTILGPPIVVGSLIQGGSQYFTGIKLITFDVIGSIHPGPVTVTLAGMTMGHSNPGSETGISVSTSRHSASNGARSGHIGGKMKNVSVTIDPNDLVPGMTNKIVTLSFTTETIHSVYDFITFSFPKYFPSFTTAPARPYFVLSDLIVLSAVVSPSLPPSTSPSPSDHNSVCHVQYAWWCILLSCGRMDAPIPAGARIDIVIGNVTIGQQQPGSKDGFSVFSSLDYSDAAIRSQAIGPQIQNVSFTIASADRVAHAKNKTVTISFKTVSDMVSGHTITIHYPQYFFESGKVVGIIDSSGYLQGYTVVEPDKISLPVTYDGLSLKTLVQGQYTVTLTGMQMGPPHANEENGIRVSTSLDIISEGSPTGMIGGQVTNVSLTIAASDRFSLERDTTVTFSFTIATALSAGDTITLHYPLGFLNATSEPLVIGPTSNAAVNTITISFPHGFFSETPTSTSHQVIATSSPDQDVLLLVPFEAHSYDSSYKITLHGAKLGGARPAGSKILLSTTVDYEPSLCVWHYNLYEPQSVSAPINPGPKLKGYFSWNSDYVEIASGKSGSFTLTFDTMSQVYYGSIYISLPVGLFVYKNWSVCMQLTGLCKKSGSIDEPCYESTSVTWLLKSTFQEGSPFYPVHSNFLDTVIVSIPPSILPISPACTGQIVVSNVILDRPYHDVFGITIATESHPISSDVISVGTVVPNCIFPLSLDIALEYRQSGRVFVPITLSFIPQSDLPSGSTITVSFPPYFFTSGPSSNYANDGISSGSIANLTTETVVSVSDSGTFSYFVFKISGALVPKFSFVSIFLKGMTIGNPTLNVPNAIRITTSTDTASCIGTDTGTISDVPSKPPNFDITNDPCACKTENISVPYNRVTHTATIQSNSVGWKIFNASEVDTCDYSISNVAAFTMIFVAPMTGFYSLKAAVSEIESDFSILSWNFMGRIVESRNGNGCCGNTAFCGSLSFISSSWIYPRLFLRANDTISIAWSTEILAIKSASPPNAKIIFSVLGIQEPVVYVDSALGLDTNEGTYDNPVASFQHGLNVLARLCLSFDMKSRSATLYVRPSIYSNTKPHTPQLSSGFVIPDQLKNVALIISSIVPQRATSIYSAFQEQIYCNYNIKTCTSQTRFFESSYGTAIDTEIIANSSLSGRAFTLKDMFSLTLQGFTIQNFKNRGDGGAIHLVNSTLIVKNCIFKMNFANSYGNGGAIYATKQSKLLVEDSIFLGHRARGSGGIVFSNGGSLLVIERSVLEGIAIDNCWSST